MLLFSAKIAKNAKPATLCKTLILASALLFTSVGAMAAETDQLAMNKKVVVDFYNTALNEKNIDAAIAMMGPTYKQHNAGIADGKQGFRQFLTQFRQKFPHSHSEIKRVIAEGDLVVLHVHMVNIPGTRGTAVMDIFRVEKGKVVEHWDVLEPVPDNIPHHNTMF